MPLTPLQRCSASGRRRVALALVALAAASSLGVEPARATTLTFPLLVERLAGTIVVGLVCYLVLRWQLVARLLLIYPELHFFTVAVLIVIGRYTGYQIVELWRFRDMPETESPH